MRSEEVVFERWWVLSKGEVERGGLKFEPTVSGPRMVVIAVVGFKMAEVNNKKNDLSFSELAMSREYKCKSSA